LFHLGELASAQEHLEQGIALYNPQKHRSRAFLQDPGVVCLSYAVFALWHLGYPDQALKRSHEALTLAQELSHPYSLGFALNWVATLHQLRRDGQLTQERAESVIVLSTEQGFPRWLAIGTILRGWVLTEQGQGEEGITQMRQGLAAHRDTGAELMRSYHLALLAEACGKGGQAEEGLSVLAETLAAVDKTGERYYEAELYRLKGALTLQQFNVQGSKFKVENSFELRVRSSESEAEECFSRAIEVARKQQAKSLELRAVMSLARLWQQQAARSESRNTDHVSRTKLDEARQMLSDIYNWFTEGFDTKDLQEAKALLAELA
jgi:predicted ATPase